MPFCRLVRQAAKTALQHFALAACLLSIPIAARAQTLTGSLASNPVAIEAATPSLVTLTIPLPEANILPSGVNLLRVSGSTTTTIGTFRDDGQGGDVAAGDRLFTVRVIVQEASPGEIRVQASAAVRGQIRRMLSQPFAIKVAAVPNLPPDPGELGKSSLEGIDSDADGVRDDLQRLIALTFPASARRRAALRQVATSVQFLVTDGAEGPNVVTNLERLAAALECSAAMHGTANFSRVTDELIAQAIDTPQRFDIYMTASARAPELNYSPSNPATRYSKCLFNPFTLPN